MHLPCSGRALLNLILIFSGFIRFGTSARSRSLHSSFPSHRPTFALASSNNPQKRAHGHQYIGDGFTLTYKTFTPFFPTWPAALTLSIFWTEIAIQIANPAWMPDDQFDGNTFRLRMPLGGLELVFEVLSFEGPVSRELVKVVATAMMGYTIRGFCGVFNACIRRRPDSGGVWIVLRMKGLAEVTRSTPPS